MPFEFRPFRVPPETEVHTALDVAREAAADMGHAEVRPEHLALALCSDPEIARRLDDLGARREAIETALEDVLEHLPCGPPRQAARDGAPPFDPVLRHAVRRADASPSGVDRLGLLAALFEESAASDAILRAGGSPSALRDEPYATPTTESAEVVPYRSADRRRTWTLRFLHGGRTPRSFLVSTARAMGLSRVATTRAVALAHAEQAPQVGLMTEGEARHHASTAEESARVDGHGLRVVAEPLPAPAYAPSRDTSTQSVAAWWRGVLVLRFSFVAFLFVAAVLSVQALRTERSNLSAAAAGRGDAERAVTVRGRVVPSGRRYLLPEALPFALDPRHAEPIATLASISAREKLDTRVAVERIGESWSTACTFVAEREIPGPISSRTTSSRWSLVRSKNGVYNILIVGGRGDHGGPLVGTVRSTRDAGRPVPELLRARCRAELEPSFVFDVDPLPDGEVQTWVPICSDRSVLNRSCAPALWGVVTDGRLADWPRDENWTSLDGWLGTVHDRRLRIESSEHADSPRTLRLGPVPRRPIGRSALPVLLFLVFGVAAGVAARRRRQRGRPRQ